MKRILPLLSCALPLVAGAVELSSADFPDISSAIAACAEKGGGRVVVPAGVHETGPIVLRSNVELHLPEGAKLVFSDTLSDYLPAVPVSWNGIECLNYSPLVYGHGVTNASVTGRGELAPRLAFWLKWRNLPGNRVAHRQLREWSEAGTPVAERDVTRVKDGGTRPHLIHLNRCRGVRLDGFRIRGTPFWTIHAFLSSDVVVRNLDVSAWADSGEVLNNSDGVDVECSHDVLVENCTFAQNDDAIVVKAGRDADGRRLNTVCENVTVRGCNVNRGHVLLGIGSEVSGGVRNVRLEDCTVNCEVSKLVFIKTNPRRGGFVENVTVDGIRAKRVTADAICYMSRWYYGQVGEEVVGAHTETTRVKGFVVRNVHCDWVDRFVTLLGDPNWPAEGFVFENVVADEVFSRFSKIEHIGSLRFDVTARKIWPETQW